MAMEVLSLPSGPTPMGTVPRTARPSMRTRVIGTPEDVKRTLARLFVAASLALGLLISFSGNANASASAHHHFDNPGPIAVCAGRAWVINLSNNSVVASWDYSAVVELDMTTGSLIRVIK